MVKYELKTKLNDANVEKFLGSITDEKKREDSLTILGLLKKVTKEEPKMWGSAIIGFGTYRYKYSSGQEGDWMCAGFSPRKQNISIYLMGGIERFGALMKKLGKYKAGKACLYINKIEDVDMKVLRELMKESYDYMVKQYPK
jgi:hypothetical protein